MIFSGVARSLGGDTEDACKAIMASATPVKHVEPMSENSQHVEPISGNVSSENVGPDGMKHWPTLLKTRSEHGRQFQCSEYTLDRLGLKNCTKWILK